MIISVANTRTAKRWKAVELSWEEFLEKVKASVKTAETVEVTTQITKAEEEARITGFELAHGIPGTVGGAVAMNEGAYDGEMKDVIVSAVVRDE